MELKTLSDVISFAAEQMWDRKAEISFRTGIGLPSDFFSMIIGHRPALLLSVRTFGWRLQRKSGGTAEYTLLVEYTDVQPQLVASVETEAELRQAVLAAAKVHRQDVGILCATQDSARLLDSIKGFLRDGDLLNCCLQSTQYSIRTTAGSRHTGIHIRLSYSCSAREYCQREAAIEQAIGEILAYARQFGPEDWKKAYAVVRWFSRNTTYGSLPRHPGAEYTAYGAIVYRKAVCMGFALAVCRIFKALGIPCRYVKGKRMGETTGHGWNLAYIKGGWFYIDVTAAVCTGDPLRQWGMTGFADRTIDGPQPKILVCHCPPAWIHAHFKE